ncbi:MAG: hypothetical protein ACKPKO_30660, partial [Candidatus Fonsibacter sp.]
REVKRFDATVGGTLGCNDNADLTDDAVQKHHQARRTRNGHIWKQRVGKDLARRSPNIVAVDPGTTVFVETSGWELAFWMLFENASAGEWTIVCLRTSGFHVTPRNPVGRLVFVLA